MSTDYDDLADRAERGELAIKPGTVRRHGSAAQEAQRMLLESANVTSIDELTRVALGRPSVGAQGGTSPVVRARVPQALKDRVAAVARHEHRNESDVVRDALAAYVSTRAAS